MPNGLADWFNAAKSALVDGWRGLRLEAAPQPPLLESIKPVLVNVLRNTYGRLPPPFDTYANIFVSLFEGDIAAAWGAYENMASDIITALIDVLVKAQELLAMERPAGPPPVGVPLSEYERSLFTTESLDAQRRIASMSVAVNGVLSVATAADAVLEVFSLGQVEVVGRAITNFIWANGMGSYLSMGVLPQLQAGPAPYLDRLYNARAQAQIPGASDLIRFQVREVFDPELRSDLVGRDVRRDFDDYMAQRGYSKFWADSYFGAHWDLPSITQLNEMLHRGVIRHADWERFVRYNDYLPAAIPFLNSIIYHPFTRVDARRMWDLRVLSERELLTSYADLGYFAPRNSSGIALFASEVPEPYEALKHKAETLVLWTKLETEMPDLRRRYANGWLSPDEVRAFLEGLGLPPARALEIYQTLIKSEAPRRLEAPRQLTLAQIVRSVQASKINESQALLLISTLGYTLTEAEALLGSYKGVDLSAPRPSTILGEQLLQEYGFGAPLAAVADGGVDGAV